MILDRITISGVDESVEPARLLDLSYEFPFVEWGVLLSRNAEGIKSRYPGRKWIEKLRRHGEDAQLKLSGHVCGAWVRELVEGDPTFDRERPEYLPTFQRIQINFAKVAYPAVHNDFWRWLKEQKKQFIFQTNDVNDLLLEGISKGVDAVPLFDKSGGVGLSPDTWPMPYPDLYNGYAGGIGPDNIREEINRLNASIGNIRIWMDMETKVRTDDKLDLAKVRAVLETAKNW